MKAGTLLLILAVFFFRNTLAQASLADSLQRSFNEDSASTNLMLQLAKERRKQGNVAEAERLTRKALTIGNELKRYGTIDSALFELAAIVYAQGDLEIATKYLEERIALEKKENDSSNLAKSYNYLGAYLSDKGKKVEAIKYELSAKEIADRISDFEVKYIVYATLGEYYHLTDYDKALDFRLKARAFAQKINDRKMASLRSTEITANIALNYVMKGDFKTAKKYLSTIANYAKRPGHGLGDHLALAYTTFGYIYALESNTDSAAFYYLKAIDFRISKGQKARLHDSYGLLGQVYMDAGRHKEAIRYLTKAVDLSKENRALHFQYKWTPVLANAYHQGKDDKRAFEVMNDYYMLTDSVMNQKKAEAVASLETQFRVREQEHENELLRKESELQSQTNQKQKLLFGGAALLAFIGGLAFYFRAEAGKQKNIALNERVDAQNRELATIALLVSKKNTAFAQVKSRLDEMSRENHALSPEIKSVVKDIEQEMDFDEEWNTFKYHFEKVHPDFFARIKEVVPSLSVTEMRMCAYLKANLSTKEIARLTNTTIRSVQQAKYRINQKFPDHNEKSLTNYLSKI